MILLRPSDSRMHAQNEGLALIGKCLLKHNFIVWFSRSVSEPLSITSFRSMPLEEVEHHRGDLGTGTMFAGHHQLGVLIGRDLVKTEHYFPGGSVDCAGNVTFSELKDSSHIDNGGSLF